MDYSRARPDLNWTPYALHLPPPPPLSQSAYLHVIVVEATSTRHPKPARSRTALYTVAVRPAAPLAVGRRVHVHLLCSSRPHDVAPANMDRAVAVPLSVAGALAGERGRRVGEVEYVLKNEIQGTGVGTAFVRVRDVPGVTAASAGIGDVLEERLRRLAVAQARDARVEFEDDARRLTDYGSKPAVGLPPMHYDYGLRMYTPELE